ncbi:MAG: glycosyltransferase [Lachnospiraceae bacterium]|nr:glycosyltransferase [Lachnospiraceae bacterium]
MKKKICFVVQRYGLEVNGGAELCCRQIAEHMLSRYTDVHVLTTKAVDYMTWEDVYEKDEEDINGVHVHRFGVTHPRNLNKFNTINARFFAGNLPQSEEREWVERQGPAVPALIDYLKEHKDDYDAFIFFTYLYYPSVIGIPEVAEKAIAVPTAHDEPFLKMKIYDNVFLRPRSFFFLTTEERELVHEKYHNEHIPSQIGGVGLDLPETVDGERFKEKFGVKNYLLYVGRLDGGKNVPELLEFFRRYKDNHPASDLQLVTIGRAFIPIKEQEDIVHLGFLPEDQDKFDGIAGAKMLILPSKFESLSMVVLEAMAVGTPVIVNGGCEVLKGHCTKSNGAFYYESYEQFEKCVDFYLNYPVQTQAMIANAHRYVDENYRWDVIVDHLSILIEDI